MLGWLRKLMVRFFGDGKHKPERVNRALTESRRERLERRPIIDRARILADAYSKADRALHG